ncbi:UNVERIFIED_CONTAM: hypothetical protein PYX00_000518 [Menopon gallinae]|uniref:NADH dehydrogenase [ubiquinone] 1 alpha subcomplex subunit 5 n=1 Tax=Menopon gallinae TaxID=328185 RepID=A0AAW2IA69_9NEOP
MASVARQATRLTGQTNIINVRKRILLLYDKILKELEKMPETASYRKHTEEIVKYKKSIVEQETNEATIEQKLGSGHISEIFLQAQNELNLSRTMLEYRPWEPLASPIPRNQWKWPPA